YSLMQPTIRPLFNTRQVQDCLLRWNGSGQNYYDYLKETWTESILDDKGWSQAVHDGFVSNLNAEVFGNYVTASGELESASADGALFGMQEGTGGFELTLYTKTG